MPTVDASTPIAPWPLALRRSVDLMYPSEDARDLPDRPDPDSMTGTTVGSPGAAAPARRPRIAYLSYSTAEFDSRTQRMAQSALAAGYEVIVYARWVPGVGPVEDGPGYRIVRVPFDWRLAVPGLRSRARRQAAMKMALDATPDRDASRSWLDLNRGLDFAALSRVRRLLRRTPLIRPVRRTRRLLRRTRRLLRHVPLTHPVRASRLVLRRIVRLQRQALVFPLRPMGWAAALEDVVEPADIWHGMWAGSLPALSRLRRTHGGRSIYDSRDVYMHSRQFGQMGHFRRRLFARIERRWARAADVVLTVNDAYAEILERTLGIPRPPVVMNCPVRWMPPQPRPDLVRETLELPAGTSVVLYQGNLMTERGVEESMDAILEVPNAVLALLGYGVRRELYAAQAASEPYVGRVFMLPPVPPSELLAWTASADVLVMAIQPTTLNHRYTTPQKLFEAFAAGVPVVASDLPGMATIVRSTGAGVVCDPTSPPAIAAALRTILGAPPDERMALSERARRAAHDRYNWEAQLATLLEVYHDLAPPPD